MLWKCPCSIFGLWTAANKAYWPHSEYTLHKICPGWKVGPLFSSKRFLLLYQSKGLHVHISYGPVISVGHRATTAKITGYFPSHLHSWGTCQCRKWWLGCWGHRNHLHNRNIHQECCVADAGQLAEILLYKHNSCFVLDGNLPVVYNY